MNKNSFYQYDFHTLEEKVKEDEFLQAFTEAYKCSSDGTIELNLNAEPFNLQRFNYYVVLLKENENVPFDALTNAMLAFLQSDKFHWNGSFAEPYLTSLRSLSYLLSRQENVLKAADDWMELFRINHQGWKPKRGASSGSEIFVCSAIALLFECEEAFIDKPQKMKFFRHLSDVFLRQYRYALMPDDYQVPLKILYMVATQIYPEAKDCFEEELIAGCDELLPLLSILSVGSAISDNSKLLLRQRLNDELEMEKRILASRRQNHLVAGMDEMLRQLGL